MHYTYYIYNAQCTMNTKQSTRRKKETTFLFLFSPRVENILLCDKERNTVGGGGGGREAGTEVAVEALEASQT